MRKQFNPPPFRDKPPCYGCGREIKMPGCHDRCEEYNRWKQELERINRKRQEEARKPFSRIV